MTIATLTENPETPGEYRVEAEDGDEKQVATFAGLGAIDCAIFFAGNYYDGWNDPQGLAGY